MLGAAGLPVYGQQHDFYSVYMRVPVAPGRLVWGSVHYRPYAASIVVDCRVDLDSVDLFIRQCPSRGVVVDGGVIVVKDAVV